MLVARRREALDAVAARCGDCALPVVGDMTRREEVQRVVAATLPHFRARGTGHVINVSSMLGRIPFVAVRAGYSAAKHYLNSLTSNFRTEVQEKHPGIQYSLVSPGVVATDFGRNARHGGRT